MIAALAARNSVQTELAQRQLRPLSHYTIAVRSRSTTSSALGRD